ncbi:MAG TPA: hypothetical protein VJN18_06745 [Polyangiaceae bacterium]|nr:hypothetical protein [Polyangiaceae bacterium]
MTIRIRTLLLVLVLTSAQAQAQSQKAGASSPARGHFEEGITHAQRGELEAALKAFQAAYQAQPHHSVLYNIGQAEAGLGRPVEAVTAFERYLNEGADQISLERRQSVLDMIVGLRAGIGRLRLLVPATEQSRVWLDGVELDASKLNGPISLEVGEHTLLHSSGIGYPVSRRVTITAGAEVEVQLEVPAEPALTVGQLAVTCDVPGVTVEISDTHRLVTPIAAPVLLAAGSIRVRFARPGYRPTEQAARIARGRLSKLDCAQRPLSELPAELRAELVVQPTPADARTFVDGQRFQNAALPAGLHEVLVEREGFVSLRTTLDLTARATRTYTPTLKRTPASLDAQSRERAERRTLAYLLGGVSAALLAASGSLFLWNHNRYEKFTQKRATSSDRRNLEFATSIQRVDDLTFGLLVGGVVGGTAGVWTYTTATSYR